MELEPRLLALETRMNAFGERLAVAEINYKRAQEDMREIKENVQEMRELLLKLNGGGSAMIMGFKLISWMLGSGLFIVVARAVGWLK